MAVPKLVLRKNGVYEPRNRNRSSFHRAIKARIALALNEEWSQLYDEAMQAFPRLTTAPTSSVPFQDARQHRCRQAVQQGAHSKAAQALLQTSTPVPPTEQTAALLQALHPSPPHPVHPLPRQNLPPPITFEEADIRRALKALPMFSSPGPDGLRPAVFKTLAHTPGGTPPDEAVLPALTEFVNDAIDGKIPSDRQQWFAGGSLIGLPKPDDTSAISLQDTSDTSLRLIAMGFLMRRFIGRMLMMRVSRDNDLLTHLLPHQLAVGVSGGCETVIHVVREVTTALKDEDMVLLRFDASNAFNSICRQCILTEVRHHTPGIARWVHFLYGSDSILWFGSHKIRSRNGTQQGDPPGMLLFALALHPLLIRLQQTFCLPLLLGYADDINAIVPRTQAPEVISFLQIYGTPIGFTLNLVKTDIWWFSPPLIENVQCTINTSRAVPVLGSPVGHDDTCATLLAKRLQTHEQILSILPQLDDPELAYHLLRSCASACLFVYTLRTTPPHLTHAEAIKFDLRQRRVFEEIHRLLADDAWRTSTLPTGNGELVLTPTSSMVEPAYVASLLNAWGVIKTLARAAARSQTVMPKIRDAVLRHLRTI